MRILIARSAHRRIACPSGDLLTPERSRWAPDAPVWAADNGCFSGAWDRDTYLRYLDALSTVRRRPLFVTMPDVVCDWSATVDRCVTWAGELRARGLPAAIVLQNGAEWLPPEHSIPWGLVSALFIGGDVAFKYCGWTRAAVRLAKRAGIHTHMGRVNTLRRLEYAMEIGVDSIDGSGLARYPEQLRLLDRHLSGPAEQLTLWPAAGRITA